MGREDPRDRTETPERNRTDQRRAVKKTTTREWRWRENKNNEKEVVETLDANTKSGKSQDEVRALSCYGVVQPFFHQVLLERQAYPAGGFLLRVRVFAMEDSAMLVSGFPQINVCAVDGMPSAGAHG